MCGIIGYSGTRPASPILLDALRVLEYRGYDSAGLYVPGAGSYKAVGPVDELARAVKTVLPGSTGIAHTRWATHGKPSVENAHPHTNCDSTVWLVHNGIIENYAELRHELEALGCTFVSDTDSEVLAHLIGKARVGSDLLSAVTSALKRVRGTYGLAVMDVNDPDTIVVARMGSPIVLGVREGEVFVASDAAPILRHTHELVYLEDAEVATLCRGTYSIHTLDHERRERTPGHVELTIEEAKKDGYPHFMLKEICEVSTVLTASVRGRNQRSEGTAKLGGLSDHERRLREIERVVIVGCGSAYYAGLVGKLLIEEFAHLPVEVELASEYRYRSLIAAPKTAVVAISQSGETADTLASIREAKRQGLFTMGVVNVVGSSIARETDAGVYNHAGPEIGVASTKAFVSQLEVLTLIAVFLGRLRGLSRAHGAEVLAELDALPEKAASIVARRGEAEELAESYLGYDDFLYIGRKYNLATAYEGALKLKEVTYVHAEGYAAGEMKHGPIAMVDEWFPTVAVLPSDSVYEKMRSNVQEIRARQGRVLGIVTEGNAEASTLADDVFTIPHTMEPLVPILATVPLQLFAYYQGVLRGYNVDRPRNLAKSVTVE